MADRVRIQLNDMQAMLAQIVEQQQTKRSDMMTADQTKAALNVVADATVAYAKNIEDRLREAINVIQTQELPKLAMSIVELRSEVDLMRRGVAGPVAASPMAAMAAMPIAQAQGSKKLTKKPAAGKKKPVRKLQTVYEQHAPEMWY